MVLRNSPQSGPILATSGLLPPASSAPALMAAPAFPLPSDHNSGMSSPFHPHPSYFMPPYSIDAVKASKEMAWKGAQVPPHPVSVQGEPLAGPLFLPLLHGCALPQQYKNVHLFPIAPTRGPQVATSLMVSSFQAVKPNLGGISNVSQHHFAPSLAAYNIAPDATPKTICMPQAVGGDWTSEANKEIPAPASTVHGSPQLLPFCVPPMDISLTQMPLQTGIPCAPVAMGMHTLPRLSLLNPAPYIIAQQSFADTTFSPGQKSPQCRQPQSQAGRRSSKGQAEEDGSSLKLPGSKALHGIV